MLVVKNIEIVKDNNVIIKNLSFILPEKKIMIIRGPSGSGKSTLLQTILGETIPKKGSVMVDDVNIHKLNKKGLQAYRRRIGFAPQNGELLARKNVYENISFALEVCDANDEEIKSTVEELLKLTLLTPRANALPHELSGGEMMRVSIARALTNRPALIMLDEPTSHLDDTSASAICKLVKHIHDLGGTILMTTHDQRVTQFFQNCLVIDI